MRKLLLLALVFAPLSSHALVKVTTTRGSGNLSEASITHLSNARGTQEPFLALWGADPAGRCLVSVDVANKSGLTLEGLLQLALQGISIPGTLDILCSEMTSDQAGKVRIRYSPR